MTSNSLGAKATYQRKRKFCLLIVSRKKKLNAIWFLNQLPVVVVSNDKKKKEARNIRE